MTTTNDITGDRLKSKPNNDNYRNSPFWDSIKKDDKTRHSGKSWSNKNILWLCDNWEKLSIHELAEKLARTEAAVKQQAAKLKLPRKDRANGVPKERIDYILKHVGKKTIQEIADDLGLATPTVYNHCRTNGIRIRELTSADT